MERPRAFRQGGDDLYRLDIGGTNFSMATSASTVIYVDTAVRSFFLADRSDARLKALDAEMGICTEFGS